MFKLLTLARNTFTETLREPVYTVIIVAALILMILSPPLTMYSMDDDNKLLREMGLSTLFLMSLFISIFAASGAVGEEIANKTILTVVSKPVPRPLFILAKFLGVAGAVALAHFICTVALLMAIRHGVLSTASDEPDWVVIASAGAAVTLTIILTAFFNYVYDWKFSSTAVVLAGVFALIALLFLTFIDRHWKFHPAENGINGVDVLGSVLLFLGTMVMTAIAVALSSRFSIIVTLAGCIGLFLLGLISDYVFGQLAQTHLWANVGRYLVPNLQVFWISDAIYEGSPIPIKYIVIAAVYAVCYSAGILSLAVALFQRRQVG